jgi:primosomal protein N'
MTCSRCDSEMHYDADVEAHVCGFCGHAVTEEGETVQRGA